MAEMVYLKAFYDWLIPMDLLSDEEVGRLFRAALLYARDGVEITLSDKERLVFASWRAQIDRDKAAWKTKSESLSKAGKRGASARWDNGKANPSMARNGQAIPSQARHGLNGQDKDKEKDKEKDKDNKVFCTEPQSASVPSVLTFPLNDGSQYGVTEEQVKEWASLYPAVDVMQQLRNMKGWLGSNPQRRKTRKGIARFITGWLSKEQDRGGNLNGQQKRPEPLSGAGKNPEEDDPWGVTGTQL